MICSRIERRIFDNRLSCDPFIRRTHEEVRAWLVRVRRADVVLDEIGCVEGEAAVAIDHYDESDEGGPAAVVGQSHEREVVCEDHGEGRAGVVHEGAVDGGLGVGEVPA